MANLYDIRNKSGKFTKKMSAESIAAPEASLPAPEPAPASPPAMEPAPAASAAPEPAPASPPAMEPAPAASAAPEPAPAASADPEPAGENGNEVPLSEDFFEGSRFTTIPPPVEPVKRGRGRPPGSTSAPKPPPVFAVAPDMEILATAGMIFDISTGSAATIFGEEWKPKSPDERNFVVQAIAAYLKTTGMKELPPKYVMIFAIAAYSAPRFAAPTTQDKIKGIWLWTKLKFGGLFKRKNKIP